MGRRCCRERVAFKACMRFILSFLLLVRTPWVLMFIVCLECLDLDFSRTLLDTAFSLDTPLSFFADRFRVRVGRRSTPVWWRVPRRSVLARGVRRLTLKLADISYGSVGKGKVVVETYTCFRYASGTCIFWLARNILQLRFSHFVWEASSNHSAATALSWAPCSS